MPPRRILPMSLRLLVALLCTIAAATLASSPPNEPYVSIRALDQFGHSVQLTHAQAAANQGRLVVVAASPSLNDRLLVVSPITTTTSTISPMVHSISIRDDPEQEQNYKQHIALVCTGIKGDATWLLEQSRRYMAQIWERYNHAPNAGAVAHALSRLVTRFCFDESDMEQEWQSSVAAPSSDTASSWARPLGLQTMVLSSSSASSLTQLPGKSVIAATPPPVLLVQPSGRVLDILKRPDSSTERGRSSWNFGCMGKDCTEVQLRLDRLAQQDNLSLSSTPSSVIENELIRVMISVSTTSSESKFLVEVVTPEGVERTVVTYEKDKEVSRLPLPLSRSR